MLFTLNSSVWVAKNLKLELEIGANKEFIQGEFKKILKESNLTSADLCLDKFGQLIESFIQNGALEIGLKLRKFIYHINFN